MTPTIGMTMDVRGIRCVIVRVLPCGTVEMVSVCGMYAFRVSGLMF